jgi:pyruvate decarboxylase
VERLIHGENQPYNDIQPWNHRLLPAVFGAAPGSYETHRVETTKQLEALWRRESFTDYSALQVSHFITDIHFYVQSLELIVCS